MPTWSSVLKVLRNETRASWGRASESSHSLALANNWSCSLAARSRYSKFQKDSLARSPLTRHIFASILSENRDHNWCQKRKNRCFFGTVNGQIKPVHNFSADFISEASENQRRTDYSWSPFDESTQQPSSVTLFCPKWGTFGLNKKMASEPRASERRALSLLARSPGNFQLLLAARSRSWKFWKVLLSLARPRAFSATFKTLLIIVQVYFNLRSYRWGAYR